MFRGSSLAAARWRVIPHFKNFLLVNTTVVHRESLSQSGINQTSDFESRSITGNASPFDGRARFRYAERGDNATGFLHPTGKHHLIFL